MLFLERGGFREETYHTFSYSPLTDDDGTIAGMLCVVSEESGRVIGERRMAIAARAGRRPDGGPQRGRGDRGRRPPPRGQPPLPPVHAHLHLRRGRRRPPACAARRGSGPGIPAAPEVLRRDDPDPAWPFAGLVEGAPKLLALDGRFPELPTGAWREPPVHAMLVDLPHQGQTEPLGFFVAGLNRYAPLDESYRAYISLDRRPGRDERRQRPRLRVRAPPGGVAGRDRPREDDVLHERQPRAAHAADAAARPGGGRARATPPSRWRRRSARRVEVIDRNAQRLLEAGQHPARLLPAAERPGRRRGSSRWSSAATPRSSRRCSTRPSRAPA